MKTLLNKYDVLIIDGNHLAYRCKFTYNLTNKGVDVSVVYGFLKSLQAMIAKYIPSSVVVCWDGGIPNFRREAVPSYKADRHKDDDEIDMADFKRQLNILNKTLHYMGVVSIRKLGVEADDLCYHSTRIIKGKKLLVSGDSDLLQSIAYDTSVYIPYKDIIIDEAKFNELYGFSVTKYIDWKALQGDSSDNIPGVYGIGEKTATKLFEEWGSITAIINAASDHNPDKSKSMSDKVRSSILSFGASQLYKNIYVMSLGVDRCGCKHEIYKTLKSYNKANVKLINNFLARNAFTSLVELPGKLHKLDKPELIKDIRMPVVLTCNRRSA